MAINSRMTPALNLTPKITSPYARSPSPKSPSRPPRNEQGLVLQKVIGTTTASVNGFDGLESANCFAFLAGGAAVVTTIDDDLRISQRYFRAKPSSTPLNPTASVYDSPTPLNVSNSSRSRISLAVGGSTPGTASFGSPIGEYAADSPTNKLGVPVDQRTKTATCLSLSRDGRLVAVGETGHKPRILIFSTAKDAPLDRPVTAISEHFFGLKCLAFSLDSKYLASLGDANDGFLYIWSINPRNGAASLHASNKCTSYVRQMAWVGKSLVTIGTRHVKIWRIQDAQPESPRRKRYSEFPSASPSPSKTLFGRNCLLGPLLDMTFTCIVGVSSTEAFVCSDQGEICLLRDEDTMVQFSKVTSAGFSISSMLLLGDDALLVAGHQGQLRSFEVKILLEPDSRSEKWQQHEGTASTIEHQAANIVAMTRWKGRAVILDSERNIRVLEPAIEGCLPSFFSVSLELLSHKSAVQGVQPLSASELQDSNFLTWSAEGSVSFWHLDGSKTKQIDIPLAQPNPAEDEWINELKVVKAFQDDGFLASGDKLGVLRIMNAHQNICAFEVRAHAGEISDIAISTQSDSTVIATAGRDRMIQVFEWKDNSCNLLQTLDEHSGAVCKLLFAEGSKKLVSCSLDRTIIIRDFVTGDINGKNTAGFLFSRAITLKTSPLSLALPLKGGAHLLVSTADKRIVKYDVATGVLVSSFKTSDSEGGEAAVMSSILQAYSAQGTPLVAGVSSADKSIRLYDENGRLVRRDYGHTEGITGIASFESAKSERFLVTVASDGTVFLWNLSSCAVEQLQGMFDNLEISQGTPKDNELFSSRPPLRRVLSSSEIAQLQGFREEDLASNQTTPSAPAQRAMKKKTSKLSLCQTPNFEPSPLSKVQHTREFSSSLRNDFGSRRASSIRSPSPTSARRYAQTMKGSPRQPSMGGSSHSRRRSLSTNSMDLRTNDLAMSTDQLCRTLHAFRKQMATSADVMPADKARELEKELSAAAKALAEKASRNETVMVKLLDQYSERLENMLDEKIATTLARQLRKSSSMEEVYEPNDNDKD